MDVLIRGYDYVLPLSDDSKRGNILFFNYPSPGSTVPSPDVHTAGIYLVRAEFLPKVSRSLSLSRRRRRRGGLVQSR